LLRPGWGVHRVIVERDQDRLLIGNFGVIGWGGNSGFGALNLAVQFGARRIVLVGFDMRLDQGIHWHGAHPQGLNNPQSAYVDRWRRVIDEAAPVLNALGIEVLNASPISALRNYRKVDFVSAIADQQAA
jgi:hypothetical protein